MKPTLTSVIPKLPTRDLVQTRDFYVSKLNFKQVGQLYPDYLMLQRDEIEIHFFHHPTLEVLENCGMCYIRVQQVDNLFKELQEKFPDLREPQDRPWGQRELYLIDNSHNGLTFGEAIS